MTETTVEKLATEVGKSVERLIEQFSQAGIKKGKSDSVTEGEKQQLLDFLKKQHGGDAMPTKMTLQRKTVSTLSVAGSGGQSKDIKVEVRKKKPKPRPPPKPKPRRKPKPRPKRKPKLKPRLKPRQKPRPPRPQPCPNRLSPRPPVPRPSA